MSKSRPIDIAKSVLLQEAEAIATLAENLNESIERAIDLIFACKGRVIMCGLGKSGHIARKAAGTFSSTGTPSLFLHAAEAVHGDLGMVAPGDVVILYTHSGETEELLRLYPSLRDLGAKTITITGRGQSSAARAGDVVLDTWVREEACPLNLAPTTSTTAMLALSDAIALAVMDLRNFQAEDFGRLHPSGSLGKRLTLRVSDVMRRESEVARLTVSGTGWDVIQAMTSTGVGAVCIVEEHRLLGLVSESDWRRHALIDKHGMDHPVEAMMNRTPATVEPDLLAIEAIEIFQNFPAKIGELPVVQNGQLLGLLVLKDLVRSGII